MTRRARRFLFAALASLLPAMASAQVSLQPTPPPLVTADNETWFFSGEAITWSGDYYYPAGAQVFFNRDQMVRSGSYRGIPLYTDTTIEPYSIVYVPLSGGLMQPYERRRSGELAGTTGSRPPSFPTVTPAEVKGDERGTALMIGQAAAEPTRARAYDVGAEPAPVPAGRAEPDVATVGTMGRPVAATRMETVLRPKGINGVWIDYAGRRWFAKGPGMPLDGAFTQSGSYHGSPVYVRQDDPSTIFLPGALNQTVVTPFSVRR